MTFPADSAENYNVHLRPKRAWVRYRKGLLVSDAGGTLSRSYDQLANLLTDARTTSTATLTTAYT